MKDKSYKEYMEKAPADIRERLFKVMRGESAKHMNQIAADIGLSATTLYKFLKNPESPMRFLNLLKIEKYLEKMEKDIK